VLGFAAFGFLPVKEGAHAFAVNVGWFEWQGADGLGRGSHLGREFGQPVIAVVTVGAAFNPRVSS
jgi:hypothetical protein